MCRGQVFFNMGCTNLKRAREREKKKEEEEKKT